MTTNVAKIISKANRIVIKVGSTLLLDQDGNFRHKWLEGFVADLKSLDCEVILVSSGATGCGRVILGHGMKSLSLEEEQAAAAVGQIVVLQHYREQFAKHGKIIGQVLLTSDDTEQRRRYLNAYNTISTLLSSKVTPIINENDVVTTAELRYGDNDRLAARVAAMMSANVLIILSNIDGLYKGNPDETSEKIDHIDVVRNIDNQIESYAHDCISKYSRGGMKTKIEAAKMAIAAGTNVLIAKGTIDKPISHLLHGGKCTLFQASSSAIQARKRWIAASPKIRGSLTVDDGAIVALQKSMSLLPAGIVKVAGKFERGEPVAINCVNGNQLGVGLCGYSSNEACKIIGLKSEEISSVLGYPARAAMVHRDNLVLL